MSPRLRGMSNWSGFLEVTLNAQQYTSDLHEWSYTAVPRISSIHPTAGSSAGGTLLTIAGSGLSSSNP